MWQDDFYRLLASDFPADVDQAYALKEASLPSSIFKYRSPDSNAVANLKDGVVWLSSAARFNDPYDSSISVDVTPALAEIFRQDFRNRPPPELNQNELGLVLDAVDPLGASISTFLKKGTDLTKQEADALQLRQKQVSTQLTQDLTSELTRLLQEALKVCSFSTEPRSLVMWAHYADCYRGFCIEYATKTLGSGRRRRLYPVVYTDKRFSMAEHLLQVSGPTEPPDPSSLSAQHLPVLAAVHKSHEWSHEHEWRLMCLDQSKRSWISFANADSRCPAFGIPDV